MFDILRPVKPGLVFVEGVGDSSPSAQNAVSKIGKNPHFDVFPNPGPCSNCYLPWLLLINIIRFFNQIGLILNTGISIAGKSLKHLGLMDKAQCAHSLRDFMGSLATDSLQNLVSLTLTGKWEKEVMISFVQVLAMHWSELPYDKGEDDAKFCH
jgi:hypothetical protein